MMPIQTKCKIADNVICAREGTCAGCPIWEKALDQASLNLDICPVCGADRAEYREKFGEEHVCYVGEG